MLYVRKWAWLNTAPILRDRQSTGPTLTRLEEARQSLGDDDFNPEMPVVVGHDQLASFLWEVGPTTGGHAITHVDIACWQHNTHIHLDAWEARTLRRLSLEYAGECARATDPNCPSPTQIVMTVQRREEVAKQMKAMLSALANQKE